MVKTGFIVEGGTEKIIVESPKFKQWLSSLGMELVTPVLDAKGGGNLLPKNIEPMVKRLKARKADYIVILTDLEDAPDTTAVKNKIGSQHADLIIVAVKAIEAWFLADTQAMKEWLKDKSFYMECPEETPAKPWDTLKEIAEKSGKPGPGSSKVAFAKRMVTHFNYSVQASAEHAHCDSAKALADGLALLTTAFESSETGKQPEQIQ